MGNLIQNERIKLYRKVSTWVLTGIVLLLNLFLLLIGNLSMSSYYSYQAESNYGEIDWFGQYSSLIQDMTLTYENDPSEIGAYYTAQWLQYLKDNNIPPEDWRTDVSWEYYYWLDAEKREENPDYQLAISFTDYSHNGSTPSVPTLTSAEDRQARMSMLEQVLQSSDWRAYLQQQIAFLDSGTVSMPEDERTVSREMYQLYLDLDIEPISFSMNYYMDSDSEGVWKNYEINSIQQNKLYLLRGETQGAQILNRSERARLEQEVEVSLERLRTNTPPLERMRENSTYYLFSSLMDQSVSFVSLLTMVMIVTAGSIIASEFSSGTVKLLLITPHRRGKIFWAKALILLELTLIEVAALFISSFLFSGILTGFQGLGIGQVLYIFGSARHMPYLVFVIYKYLLMLVPVLVYSALALMLSAVTRRGAAAIAVSLVLMYAGEIIVAVLVALASGFGFEIPGMEFLLFTNTNLTNYLPGASSVTGLVSTSGMDTVMTSLPFSLSVLLVYFVCFLWIARDSFCRRDIK